MAAAPGQRMLGACQTERHRDSEEPDPAAPAPSEKEIPMASLLARSPVLVDSRAVALALALLLALVSFVATGHVALARSGTTHGGNGGG
jgi:hypothetical protein